MHYTVLVEHFLSLPFDGVKHTLLPAVFYERSLLDNIFLMADTANKKQFEELFIQMFQSYSFKQSLIASFFRTYHLAIFNSQANLSSLAFQLITSHELVSWVVATVKEPLLFNGGMLEVDFEDEHTFDVLIQYISNLKSLCKLQHGANLEYIRLYLSDVSHLGCLNYYFQDVEAQWTDSAEDSLITDSFYIEVEVLEAVALIVKVAA